MMIMITIVIVLMHIDERSYHIKLGPKASKSSITLFPYLYLICQVAQTFARFLGLSYIGIKFIETWAQSLRNKEKNTMILYIESLYKMAELKCEYVTMHSHSTLTCNIFLWTFFMNPSHCVNSSIVQSVIYLFNNKKVCLWYLTIYLPKKINVTLKL